MRSHCATLADMEEDIPKVELPGEGEKPVRLDFPKGATAKEIAAAIEKMRAAKGFGETFTNGKT